MMWIVWLSWFLSVASAQSPSFNDETAQTLSKGTWSIGIFGPLRYGLKEDIELSLHPGWAIAAPHLTVKKRYVDTADWVLSSRHRIGHPSPLLRVLARPGIGGILAADSVVPHIVNSENQLLATKNNDWGQLTARVGFAVAASFGDSDYRTVDAPLAYRKTAVFQDNVGVQAGLGIEMPLTNGLGYRYQSDLWYLPRSEGKWASENGVSVFYVIGEHAQIQGGALVVAGAYPYGANWHVLPTMDAVFCW